MPTPAVYDDENKYWPWGRLVDWAAEWIAAKSPRRGIVFDYMCGTGYLLRSVAHARPDLQLFGCDVEATFVEYALNSAPGLNVISADATTVVPTCVPDFIVCTAGLHHLHFEEHVAFIDKLWSECGAETTVLIGEEVLSSYDSGWCARKKAALRLGRELILYGIESDWPAEQIDAAIQVLQNDLYCRGEYKRSLDEWRGLLQSKFTICDTNWIWGSPSAGGDVILICQKKP